ncbi:hypothetical protein EMPS_02571 [Entomortierella parvispora]|uniref:RRM Nup35-type domain-containing protein n=1 Tax=Entomortierella parvispora TaxID=205924 RepID=A0A9P3LTS6_9FUNG|nr:hypothetical protein EMPS_02571 [Entomortierella parvispora]
MFAFNASGLSSSGGSQSRSTRPASGKSGYVPSVYIKKQLELEEEARRQREQGESLNGSLDAYAGGASGSPSAHWRGPEEVLAPGYHSGALGYQLPTPAPPQPSFAPKIDQEDAHRFSSHSVRFDDGAGVGLGVQNTRKESVSVGSKLYPDMHGYSNGSSRSSAFVDAPQTHSPFSGSTATIAGDPSRKSIIRSESRTDVGGQSELQKKNSVRFSSSVAKEMGSPRPGTPSIYSQGGSSSPFFTGMASSSSSIHSVSKEDDKIDIFGHRAAAAVGAQALNSSLGPALGSVSGATQSSQIYSTPRAQGDMNMSSLRNSGFGAAGPGSASFLGHDGSVLRQAGKQGSTGKNALGDEEEDKDKERYMPAVLLSYTPGLKGTKLEPFVDGKQDWDSDPFQSNSSGAPRPPPHLVGEDAPPGDSLDDIARKEGYYSRPTSSLSQFRGPNQDTRSDSEMVNAADSSIGVNGSATARSEEPYDSIITYGFPPEAASYVLNQFRDFGSISRHETGTHGHKDDSFNWLKIQYTSAWSAKNACSRHLKAVGKFIVGVHPCRSFSNKTVESSLSSMAMDTGASGDLTEAESREIGAGVDALLMMRTTGQDMTASKDQTALATSTRQASLAESWNQGSSGARVSAFGQSLGFGESVSRKVDTSATAGDEDMAFILGRSLTSGGTIGRPHGRDSDREISGDLLRSRSKDPQQQLGASQKSEKELGLGVSGLLEGSTMDSTPGELPSVGFRPLFGQNESRGLYNSTSGPSESLLLRSTAQQQQQQHHQEYQQRTEQQAQGASNARMSWRRPLGDSGISDNTLFSSSGGVLMSSSRVSSSLHVPKKQRLSSSLFSPVTGSAEAGPWLYSSGGSGVHGSFQLNRFGKDRASLLIDDPTLVDDLGRSIQSPGMPSVPGGISSTGSKIGGMNGNSVSNGYSVNGVNRTQMPLNGASGGSSSGSARQGGVAKEPESMIASAINMAKKRFFWG